MSVQIETEPAALTGEQRLYAAMQEFVNPATYHGRDCTSCLFGQVAEVLGIDPFSCDVEGQVARHFGADPSAAYLIYHGVTKDEYRDDYRAAMEWAAEKLGLTPTGKED